MENDIEFAKYEAFVDGVQTSIDILKKHSETVKMVGPVIALETFLAGYNSVRKEFAKALNKKKADNG
jgi:hypothetical protein